MFITCTCTFPLLHKVELKRTAYNSNFVSVQKEMVSFSKLHNFIFVSSIYDVQSLEFLLFFYVVLHCVLQIQLETSYQTCQRKEVRPRSLRSCVPLTLCQIERTYIKDGNGNPRIPGMLEKVTCQSMMTGAVGKVERRGQTKGNLVMVKENLCKGLNLLKVIFGVQHIADVKQVLYSHEKIFRQNFKWI